MVIIQHVIVFHAINGHVMVVGGYSIVLILDGYEGSTFKVHMWSSLERSWGPGSSPVLNLIKLLIHSCK